jgi:hypothetical protein
MTLTPLEQGLILFYCIMDTLVLFDWWLERRKAKSYWHEWILVAFGGFMVYAFIMHSIRFSGM